MGIRYIHLRVAIENWIGLVTGFHPKGGRTIAYEYDKETKTVRYTYSKCRSTEHYVKRLGRQEATARLANGGDAVAPVVEFNAGSKHPVEAILEHFEGLADAHN